MPDLPTEESFLRDVAEHGMEIRHDDGLYRHLRFSWPKTMSMWFDIVTWPGHLTISGDMGCYSFSRTQDMFEFFRVSGSSDPLSINPCYWTEKLQAIDVRSGVEKFSPEKFRKRIRECLDEWLGGEEASKELLKGIDRDVLSRADDGEHEAVGAAMSFEHAGRFPFQGFHEVNCKEYDYRYIWCLYAIAWAVKTHDAAMVMNAGVPMEVDADA